ncbi:MAG: threonine synthase [Chloroflexi bacterium]|nr:threonine synthase [Chloroflexota bacterium]
MNQGVLQTYHEFLPITTSTPMISLGEGSTPLVRSHRMAAELGLENLYFKLEGCNPTGSFKDRGMVMAVANALENQSRTIICASTGNTSASAAAYGAHCNLSTVVLVPKGNVARGKIAQAIAYGAHILLINGSFDRALAIVRELSERHPIALVNSVNPYRIEGQKTAAFEISDALGDAPDFLCIPVGNAGNISAYWKGFKEYHQLECTTHTPQMFGFQAEGSAPIVRGAIVEDPETIATAIRIGNPASWQTAVEARDESGGLIDAVTDEEILAAYKLLARLEGIFCEPASAASVAGLIKSVGSGLIPKDKTVVCILTGTGLKDPDLANQIADIPLRELSAESDEVERIILSL